MYQFLVLLRDFWLGIWSKLENTVLDVGGSTVSVAGLLIAAIIFGFAINIFWRGAKA